MTDTSDESIDAALRLARQELQQLCEQRDQEKQKWQDERQQSERQLQRATEALHHKLSSKPQASMNTNTKTNTNMHIKVNMNMNMYMTLLKQSYNSVDLPPPYVLKQQTTLLMNMHANFGILPNQVRLMQAYQGEIHKYLHAELDELQHDHQQATQTQVERVSLVAEENTVCYDAYQRQLEALQSELRELSLLIPKDNDDGNDGNENKAPNDDDGDDDTIDLTQHSISDHDYDDESSMQSSFSFSKLHDSFSNVFRESVVHFATEQLGKIPVG
jgi:hypothetical protein